MTIESGERAAGPTVEQRMLDAGIRLWNLDDASTTFGGLSVSRVAKEAGTTRATFYSYWSSTAEYLRDLLADLDRRRSIGHSAEVIEQIARMQSPNSDILERFQAACNIRASQMIADPAFRVRLGFLSKADDPSIAAELQEHYRAHENDTQELNLQIRTHWGREPRPPFTEERLQSLFRALLDGITIRHLIDPERMPQESFGIAGAMLMMIATRATDDPRDVDDMLGAINQWPAAGVRLATSRRVDEVQSTAPLPDSTRRATVAAARRMLAEDNWVALSIDDIAIAVGIDADRLLRTFGSKIGLALSIIALNAEERWQETPRSEDPMVDLQALLDIILLELRSSPTLGQSVIQILAGTVRLPDQSIFNSPPVPEIARLLAEAKRNGQILESVDPAAMSTSLTRIMLAEGNPVSATGVNRIDSLSYILEGIRVRP
jgi:AcrR family transcriptional regulator